MSTRIIEVTAVVMIDDAGRVAHVRKRGTGSWMFPGGKPEPGETPAETGARELAEELGVRVAPAALEPKGRRVTATANEPGMELHSEVVLLPASAWVHTGQQPAPAAEIAELCWVVPGAEEQYPQNLAPLSRLILTELA